MNTDTIFSIQTPEAFEVKALAIFRYQYQHVSVYREFCDRLNIDPHKISSGDNIPFLPIQFFKSNKIISKGSSEEKIFMSSGTTQTSRSRHFVKDLSLYKRSFLEAFKFTYGEPKDWCIIALLPNYLGQGDSSLVYMVDDLIKRSNHPDSGFYLDDLASLAKTLEKLECQHQKTLLFGVSYALLDLIEFQNFNLQHTVVVETGGMKGRRKELLKEELHELLKNGFGVQEIHSEYGMTELLSQAYSTGNGVFRCPPWMQLRTRDPEDPLSLITNRTGGINVIDLANIHSCSFIATDDLGRLNRDGSFEILGRFDNSDIRGCNLMVL